MTEGNYVRNLSGPGPADVLHTCGAWCPVGEPHLCLAFGTKLSLHAEKAPNRAISGEQGEFCTGSGAVRLVLGEFCTEAARRGSCWAKFVSPWRLPCVQLPGFRHPPAPQPGPRPLQRARHWWRWGFCSIRSWLSACRRRVAPLMLQFPPIGGGAAAVRVGAVAKVQTHWMKTVK